MINFSLHGHLCRKIIAGSKGMLTTTKNCAVCVNIRHASFCQRKVCVCVCVRGGGETVRAGVFDYHLNLCFHGFAELTSKFSHRH